MNIILCGPTITWTGGIGKRFWRGIKWDQIP